MSKYPVKQVAKLSGVSVRTLHHYDEIGLLKPASVGENGYRYYGREELLRLQQIMFHRELEFPLEAIAAVLSAPEFDRVEALRRHRTQLQAKLGRYRRLLATLDRTLVALEGATDMDDKQFYQGFPSEKQAQYEAWLVGRFGGDIRARIDSSRAIAKGWTAADLERMATEAEAIEAAMAKALQTGLPADSAPIGALMRRHHAWVARSWPKPPGREAFAGLGQLYLEHLDFRARYDGRQPGLAEYLAEAMRAFAERELE
jgi:DNA-binding transcriptional MerR regulator